MLRVTQNQTPIKYLLLTDSSDHVTGKTGIVGGSATVFYSVNGGAATSIAASALTWTEVSAANMPGLYRITLTSALSGTLGDVVLIVTASGADPYRMSFTVEVEPAKESSAATAATQATTAATQATTAAADALLAKNRLGVKLDTENAGARMERLLALSMFENAFMDNMAYNATSGQMTSARVRVFDTAANASAATKGGSETTGVLATYTVTRTTDSNGRVDSNKAVKA